MNPRAKGPPGISVYSLACDHIPEMNTSLTKHLILPSVLAQNMDVCAGNLVERCMRQTIVRSDSRSIPPFSPLLQCLHTSAFEMSDLPLDVNLTGIPSESSLCFVKLASPFFFIPSLR